MHARPRFRSRRPPGREGRRAAPALLGLFLVLSASTVAAASDAHVAEFQYAHGSAASGTVQGRCDSSALLFPLALPGSVRLESRGGVLERYVTEWNTTVLLPGSGNPTVVPSELRQLRSADVPLAPGVVRVQWPQDGRVRAFAGGWPGLAEDQAPSRFQAEFDAQGLVTGPLVYAVDAGQFFIQDGDHVTTLDGGVGGWNRLADARDGTLRVTGDLTLYLEAASVVHEDGTVETQPVAHERTTVHDTPAASIHHHRHHHMILRLADARLDLAAEEARFSCASLTAQVDGTLLAHGATGTVRAGNESLPFGPSDLSLGGQFALSETISNYDAGPPHIVGSAEGEFGVVGLDFQDTGIVVSRSGLVAAATAGTLLLVLVSVLSWRLYTRLEKPALLDLETRTILVDALRANPWSSVAEIERITGRSRSTVRYQLGVLKRHGLLRSERQGGGPRFAVRGDSEAPPAPVDPIVKTLEGQLQPGRRRLAEIMRALMQEHEYSRFGAWKAIRRASSQGRIQVERDDQGVWVSCPA